MIVFLVEDSYIKKNKTHIIYRILTYINQHL